MKVLITVFALLFISVACLAVFYQHLEQRVMPKNTDAFVLSVPADFSVKKNSASYQGKHPRALTRPQETFPFPIELGATGPVVPLFAGANQYPFRCDTERSQLGQPLVDNNLQQGVAIYAIESKTESESASVNTHTKTDQIAGYSQNCSLPTRIQYYVKSQSDHNFTLVTEPSLINHNDQSIIRIETGTINRFIYVLAIPVNAQDLPARFNRDNWNKKLLYRFKGGIGVGRQQGNIKIEKLLFEHAEQLEQGFAVAFSTGTQTSNHFNIWLSEDTALRVKRQFVSRYGQPLYTIGIGGSGGAIQQYLLAQNRPGIIDAAIALYAYPDMVTQVNYALDCELLEYYFDETSVTDHHTHWQQWSNRVSIQGSNAIHHYENRYGYLQGVAAMMNGDFSKMPMGASECTNGWRGVSHLINNPAFTTDYIDHAPSVLTQTDWSHWGDVHHLYGTDEQGLGRRFWGNEGVQYGLRSLRNKSVTPEAFIALNKKIGGWKPTGKMENDRFWHISGDDSLKRLSLWGQHNMTHEGQALPAARTLGDQQAALAAYNAGLVFLGLADIPIVDLRHYRDHELDMHHALASFVTRKRIEYASGSSEHQLIWMMEKDDTLSRKALIKSLPIDDALRILDQWLLNISANPEASLAANRPAHASDRCYDKSRVVIDSTKGTWDGPWNQKAAGACQQRFPHYTQSRFMAGESIYGDTLYCEKQSIAQAIGAGVYGTQDMSAYQTSLERIFPNGVCRYEQGVHPKVSELVKALRQLEQRVEQ